MISCKVILSIFTCCFLSLNTYSQSIDSIACKKVEDTLKVIENYLSDANSDPHLNRIAAIAFLLDISKIQYEGEVTFIGTEFPAKSFYTKCKDWFIINKNKLVWNAKQNRIFMRETKLESL